MPSPDAEWEQALSAARWEAHLAGRPQVDSAHLLLGLMHLPQSQTMRALRLLGVEPRWDRLRGPVTDPDAWPPPPDSVAPSVPLGREAQRVLALAEDEAQQRGKETLGLAALVVGLLREPAGLGGLLLRASGITLDKARGLLSAPGANP